ncbi:diacylglycerol/lipid kinase family protein [Daejeonella oryzae]|uniref:diacylglycerol/lipid kinase family protein n=1 Tax=Daejeonella oryzae TaxID=1122943 RepID=UPI0004089DCB|nr:diacylglycerol kinase family protein [Daejeonella oryzae]
MKKNILFIINPISGGISKLNFPLLADRYLDKNHFNARYLFSERIGHAHILAAENVKNDTDIIVAVGGDGTINEIASALVGTNKTMGIIPCGSGNGLARALKIPLGHKQAVSRLNKIHATCIDSGLFNNKCFFNMAGIGFDAHISKRFADDVTRGLKGYVRTTFTEINQYRSQNYKISIDGKLFERDAFMISIANSSQFGNNAHISPFASVSDGLLDVCIIKPFPMYHFPVMGFHMFSKTAHRSRFVEIIQGREIKIIRNDAGAVHLDGEPQLMGADLEIEIRPLSLTILT